VEVGEHCTWMMLLPASSAVFSYYSKPLL